MSTASGESPPSRQRVIRRAWRSRPGPSRSEEHTSELQSLMRNSYAVFCLEKKKHTEMKPKRNTKKQLTLSTIKIGTLTRQHVCKSGKCQQAVTTHSTTPI